MTNSLRNIIVAFFIGSFLASVIGVSENVAKILANKAGVYREHARAVAVDIDPWQGLADAFNDNFERLAYLTCSGPVMHRFVVGDLLTSEKANDNFRPIIKAIEQEKCVTIKRKGK